ncbi:MAG: winged helix-turn-helix transcriptional regulator [Fimbriimonadaceae bacterium]|nr:winged helix-turn-helix transcriptional regulator [Fimbriimonadaceae bacterium]
MDTLVAFGKALADPTRVRILHALRREPLCVCEMMEALEIGQSTLSTHLQTLRSAGVVETERRGTWIIYSISPEVRGSLETIFVQLLSADERLQLDTARLESRIRLRIEGCCPADANGARVSREGAALR